MKESMISLSSISTNPDLRHAALHFKRHGQITDMAWNGTGVAGFLRGAFRYQCVLQAAEDTMGEFAGLEETFAFQEACLVCFELMGEEVDMAVIPEFGEKIASRTSTPVNNVNTNMVGQDLSVNKYDEVVYFASAFASADVW